MTKRVDTVETVVDVFNIAMDIQELYLRSLEILGIDLLNSFQCLKCMF